VCKSCVERVHKVRGIFPAHWAEPYFISLTLINLDDALKSMHVSCQSTSKWVHYQNNSHNDKTSQLRVYIIYCMLGCVMCCLHACLSGGLAFVDVCVSCMNFVLFVVCLVVCLHVCQR